MTFYIIASFCFLMMVSRRVVGEDVLHTALCFAPPVSRVLKFQWLTTPYKAVEIPYLLDMDPNILPSLMKGSKI